MNIEKKRTIAKSSTPKRTPKPPKKKRDREASEKKLIAAAIEMFAKCGYDGTTTKEISKRAKVNESLIVRYFGGKEGLLLSITSSFIKQHSERKVSYAPAATLGEELKTFCKEELCSHIEDGDFFRIIMSRAAVDAKFCKYIQSQIDFENDGKLVDRLLKFKASGQLRKDVDLKSVKFVLVWQVFGTVFLAHLVLGMSREKIEQSLLHFAENYARGLAP